MSIITHSYFLWRWWLLSDLPVPLHFQLLVEPPSVYACASGIRSDYKFPSLIFWWPSDILTIVAS